MPRRHYHPHSALTIAAPTEAIVSTFKDLIERLELEHEYTCNDRDGFDKRISDVASMHSPDDNTTCNECGKPHPCPTLQACE